MNYMYMFLQKWRGNKKLVGKDYENYQVWFKIQLQKYLKLDINEKELNTKR